MSRYLFLLLSSITLAASSPTVSNNDGPARLIYQFPNFTRIENIAVRSTGQLLFTTLTGPELRSINPLIPNPTPSILAQIPSTTSLLGITELEPDVFAVAAGPGDPSTDPDYSIWTVNLRHPTTPVVRKAATMPTGATLNGLARLSRSVVLGSDVVAGAVHRIDLATGQSSVALQDETMGPLPGVNGIRIHGRYLHYVNYGRGLYCRVPIDLRTGMATGPVEVLSGEDGGLRGADDFALSRVGSAAYIAVLDRNALVKVAAGGSTEVVAGGPDGKVFVGPTSAQFGRTLVDRETLYVVSSGAVFNPDTGAYDDVEGGKIVAARV